MASSLSASQGPRHAPNPAFRQLRGTRSPAEFAAAVRRAARDIGEQVACDARYIGRVEAGEIRCPNYAYERVFLHMFPGRTLADLGFADRDSVRGPRGALPTGARKRRFATTDGARHEELPVRSSATAAPRARHRRQSAAAAACQLAILPDLFRLHQRSTRRATCCVAHS